MRRFRFLLAVAGAVFFAAQALAAPIPYYTTPLSPADLQNILNNLITQINAGSGGGPPGGMSTNGSNATAAALGNIVVVATGCGGTTNFVRADGTCQTPAGAGNVSTSGTITTGTLGVWASGTGLAGTQAFGATGNSTVVETDSGGHIANSLIFALPNANLANSSVTLNGHSLALGGSLTLQFTDFTGAITAAQMLALAQDNVYVGNGSAQPAATAVGSCSAASSALTYNTGTHAFGCNTFAGANPSATSGASPVNGSATTFMRSDAAPAIGTNAVTNTLLAQANANTIKGNATGSTANETDVPAPSCPDSGGNHLNWISGTGFLCGNTSTGGTAVVFVGPTTNSGNNFSIASPTPSGFSLTNANQFIIRTVAVVTNTAAATLNVNSTGALPIVANTQNGLSALVGGELVAGLEYDFTASNSSASACGGTGSGAATCYVLGWRAQSTVQAGTTQTITAAQWANFTVLDVTTASQTLTLPASTGLSGNGGLGITTVGQSVTLTPNGTDNINGANVSLVIPANTFAVVSKYSAGNFAVGPGSTVTAGTYVGVTVDAFGRVTAGSAAPLGAASGGSGAATLTAHGLMVGEGTSAVAATGPVADSVPVWGSAASDPTTAGTSSTADSVLGWGAAGAAPAPEALTSCSGASSAVTYNTSTHAFGCNTISSGGITPNPAYITSSWYLPWSPNWSTFANSGTLSTTVISCSPGTVWQSIHVNGLSMHMSTLGTSNLQMAIYNSGTGGLPSTKVASTGNVPNNSTNTVTGSVGSTSVPAGEYWFCNMQNDTTEVAFVNGGAASNMGAVTMGDPAASPGFFANSSNQIGINFTGQTFNIWPADLTGATMAADFAHSAAIAFKVASVP